MNPHDVDTWYVLADGTKAHPADVSADEAGVLKHSNGVAVALRENGLPLTTGDANKVNAIAAEAGKEAEEKVKAEAEAKVKADAEPKRLADEAAAAKAKSSKGKAAKPGDAPAEADREIKAGEGAKSYETR